MPGSILDVAGLAAESGENEVWIVKIPTAVSVVIKRISARPFYFKILFALLISAGQ